MLPDEDCLLEVLSVCTDGLVSELLLAREVLREFPVLLPSVAVDLRSVPVLLRDEDSVLVVVASPDLRVEDAALSEEEVLLFIWLPPIRRECVLS